MRLLLIMNGSQARYTGGADEARLKVWRTYCRPSTELEIGHLPEQDESGQSAARYDFGVGQAAAAHGRFYPRRCEEAEQEGYDAVIMHCAADPGLAEARQRVRIPVIGPGEITLLAGAMLGQAIGVTVPSQNSIAQHHAQIHELGLNDRVVGLEPVGLRVGRYGEQDPVAMTDATVAAAKRLVRKGAQVICPTGLAFIPVRVRATDVADRVGVPVVDPALLSVRMAESLATLVPAR